MSSYDWEAPGATALIVPAPEAETVIGRFRRGDTPSGATGMEAHVTLLAPFFHGSELSEERIGLVREALRAFRAFPVALRSFGRFGELGVLYLAPEPREPFVAMSEALLAAFPECVYPPEGATEIVPHVTVASRLSPQALDGIEAEVRPRLPIETVAGRVVLAERGEERLWTERAAFRLPTT